jgi:hypothetical protein
MRRYIRVVAAAAILTGGLGSVGCATNSCATGNCAAGGGSLQNHASVEDRYRNAVDVSWPDRYNYAARESVLAPFAQQVATGHFIDQTLWNWYFEPGSDKLTAGGIDKLDALSRETPAADPRLYLQTARDIIPTQDNMDKVAAMREDLNARRAAAIKKYMTSQPGAPVAYEVYVHDSPVPGIYSPFGMAAFAGMRGGYKGGIVAGASGGGTGGGAAGQGQAPLVSQTTNNAPGGGGGAPGGGTPGGSGSTPPNGGY